MEVEVPPEDLKKFEAAYYKQLKAGKVLSSTQFDYAWSLVHSKYPADIRKGLVLLEDLFMREDETNKRDYIYYLAVGNAKIKEYSTALKFARGLLEVEPDNRQTQELEQTIKKKMEKEGLVGMAVGAGMAAVAVGGLLGLGIALLKKK